MAPTSQAAAAARVLVVEDEPHLADGIVDNLEAEGYDVRLATDGDAALEIMAATPVDLLVLDVMLPKRDGYEVCRALRGAGSDALVLFLSAKHTYEERVVGLDAGGDDYLGKPFDLRELLARVRALLRRRSQPRDVWQQVAGGRFHFANALFIDAAGRQEVIDRKEALLLRCLLAAAGATVLREALSAAGWRDEVYPSSRELDGWIARLRARLEVDPQAPRYLLGTPIDGYCLKEYE